MTQLTVRCLAAIYVVENLSYYLRICKILSVLQKASWAEWLHYKLEEATKTWDCQRIQIGRRLRLCRQKKTFKKTGWISSLNSSQAACLHLMYVKAPNYFLLFQSCPAFHPQFPFPKGTEFSTSRQIHCSALLSIKWKQLCLADPLWGFSLEV